MQKYKPFAIIKKSLVWYIILSAITTIAAFILCFFCVKYQGNIWLSLFKDIAVIIASTISVSLLLGLLLEKSSKEDFYAEIIGNAITSDFFLKRLSADEKQQLVDNVNRTVRCNDNASLHTIYSSFENRFVEKDFSKDGYYMEECRYDIECKVTEHYIEKTCVKTMKFKSYETKYTLKTFSMGTHSMKTINEKNSFEMLSVSIDGNQLKQKEMEDYIKYEKVPLGNQGPLLCGENIYNFREKCFLNKEIRLKDNKAKTISYKYITRTELSDNALTVRCSMPCKKFTVNYDMKSENYRLKAVAFGFIDRGDDSPNISSETKISVEFDKWILPEDGVVIMINKV